jgi:hypothetical protein
LADLTSYKEGLRLVELAWGAGLRLIPDGEELDVRRDPTAHDVEKAWLVVEALKAKREVLTALTSDPESIRQALADTQKRLATGYEWVTTHLDLWDRLEKAYRRLYPDDLRCVCGDKCADDAVVRCKMCEGDVNGSQEVSLPGHGGGSAPE